MFYNGSQTHDKTGRTDDTASLATLPKGYHPSISPSIQCGAPGPKCTTADACRGSSHRHVRVHANNRYLGHNTTDSIAAGTVPVSTPLVELSPVRVCGRYHFPFARDGLFSSRYQHQPKTAVVTDECRPRLGIRRKVTARKAGWTAIFPKRKC